MSNSDDDEPRLSAHALQALNEFIADQVGTHGDEKVDEDWQLSQFWYNQETADALAAECANLVKPENTTKSNQSEKDRERPHPTAAADQTECQPMTVPFIPTGQSTDQSERSSERSDATGIAESTESSSKSIAFVSSPTAFKAFHRNYPEYATKSLLLEFDRRFEAKYPEHFIFYDYNAPCDLPDRYRSSIDIFLIDPPFLSDECFEKVAETVRFLASPAPKILLCTGATMTDKVKTLWDVDLLDFVPKHERNLANEFRCFANFRPTVLK